MILNISFLYSLGKYSSDSCQWKFVEYSPSSWEIYWHNNITYLQNRVCATLKQEDQINKSIASLEYIINLQKTIYDESSPSTKYDDLFSKMFYRYECSGIFQSNRLASQYIEPLIGLIRDPLTICSYKNLPEALMLSAGASVQSKRFFLLGPSAPYQNFHSPTVSIAPWLYRQDSQKILFDLGSSYFNGMDSAANSSSTIGTRWFYEYFRATSLRFDRVIAFEARQYSAAKYWNQIPSDLIGSFTFINSGVDKSGKFNPWNILKTIAKPHDYVIIKLDIDTPSLEGSLANQVLNDPTISSLIDEMFFEMHVTINEMKRFWGSPQGQLKDTYKLFTKLRQLGIRMHSWP